MNPRDIDSLVADLRPVRPMSGRIGMAIVIGMAALAVLMTAIGFGLRPDVLALHPSELVLLRSGTLLLVGLSAAAAVIASAQPGVGLRRGGWRWALAAAALFPLTSLLLVLGGAEFPAWIFTARSVPFCLGISLVGALAIAGPLVLWLRRGAVTEQARVGWLVGLTAGALGTFAYNLACPSDTVHYAAVWYTLTVATAAVIGRLTVPPLLRW